VTTFNLLQLLIAAAAAAITVVRLRVLWFEAELDVDAFLDAFETAFRAGELELARRIAEACLPAWSARLALDALARLDPQNRPDQLEYEVAEASNAAWRGRVALLTLGRIAGPLALIGVILELGAALHESGLTALERGLPVRIGIERSLLTFALGLATSVSCFAAAASVDRSARRISRGLQRVRAVLAAVGRTEPRDM
jgi:hypothetical protein